MPDQMPLTELSPSEARGELLAVARAFAGRRRPQRSRRPVGEGPDRSPQHRRPAPVDDARCARPRRGGRLRGGAAVARAPLGSSSVVAPSSQDRALTTMRSSEVVSDPTNVLALECARRLAADAAGRIGTPVHRAPDTAHAASGRRPGRTQHFRLFALAEAGAGTACRRIRGARRRRAPRRLPAAAACGRGDRTISCSIGRRRSSAPTTAIPALADRLVEALADSPARRRGASRAPRLELLRGPAGRLRSACGRRRVLRHRRRRRTRLGRPARPAIASTGSSRARSASSCCRCIRA